MTTDREAACWLMAALLVVVLTFSAAGCGTSHQRVAHEAPVVAAAPLLQWTVIDQAQALPEAVAQASRAIDAQHEQAAALGFDPLLLGDAAVAAPLFTLEQAAQIDALVLPATGVFEIQNPEAEQAPANQPEDKDASEAAAAAGASGAPGTPVAAGGALTDALARGVQAAAALIAAASPGAVALGLGGAAVFGFALQALVMALSLREPAAGPRLTLGPASTPFPRPPAGGAARPLPFQMLAASGHMSLKRAA